MKTGHNGMHLDFLDLVRFVIASPPHLKLDSVLGVIALDLKLAKS